MTCITDNVATAVSLLPALQPFVPLPRIESELPGSLLDSLFGGAPLSCATMPSGDISPVLIAGEAARSQYDALIELVRQGVPLPDCLVCLAGQGRGFHGFRNRTWVSPPGNIYLSVHFSPNQAMPSAGSAFMILAAMAALRAIDAQPGFEGRAGIKWVNDILIDNAKVCGVLAHTAIEGDRVTDAVLGIGLNVLSSPSVPPTPFVPRAAALNDIAKGIDLASTLASLLKSLREGYDQLRAGRSCSLLDEYRDRSLVIGRRVEVWSDRPGREPRLLADGVVSGFTDRLELLIEGHSRPVASGRLVFEN